MAGMNQVSFETYLATFKTNDAHIECLVNETVERIMQTRDSAGYKKYLAEKKLQTKMR